MLGRTREELLYGGPGHLPIANAEYQEWIAFLKFEATDYKQEKG